MPEPRAVTARMQSFASDSATLKSVTLLTVGSPAGVTGYLSAEKSQSADSAALNLAQAVSARAEKVKTLPDLSNTNKVAVMRFNSHSATDRATQYDADPSEVARRVAATLRSGADDDSPSWIAISIRQANNTEKKRVRRWYEHRLATVLPTHHVMDGQAVSISVTAGGDDAEQVRRRIRALATSLPGFDLAISPRVLNPWIAGVYPLIAGAGAVTALHLLDKPIVWRIAAGVAAALLSAAIFVGKIRSADRRVIDDARAAIFARPPRRILPPRKPKAKKFIGERVKEATAGDYPLPADVFMVGPGMLAGVIAPHAGAASGSSVTELKSAPAALIQPGIGPFIGFAGDDNTKVYLSATDAATGLAAIGRPGSGKSVLIHNMFAWNCLERIDPQGIAGFPGRSNTLIAFESKGEGARVYRNWADHIGDASILIEIADPTSPAIDVFDVPGTLQERVRLFTNMLVYSFADGSIQGQSYEALEIAITGALVVTDNIASKSGQPIGASPIVYAYTLLGGKGDAAGKELATAIGKAAADAAKAELPMSEDLTHAKDQVLKIYNSSITENSRRSFVQAARNKISELVAAESWWSPDREKISWRDIISGHLSVIINTGPSMSGHRMDERLSNYMTSILTYAMVQSIKDNCIGWQETGRSVSIFSDELSQMAGSSAEIMTWLHDQGRAYGVRPYLATQRIQQLPIALRDSLIDYSTVLWFAQSNADAAQTAASDLSADGSDWSVSDITGLDPYVAAVRTYVNQSRQPAVPVRLAFFDKNMGAFAGEQGYEISGAR